MLSVKNLSKTYKGGKRAVNDVSFEIKSGDIFGFIGPNGAGKTTTIKCITGILDFTDGEITIDGKSIKDDPVACKMAMAYIPDNPDLYEYMTGIQYLNFIADIFRIPSGKRETAIVRYADAFELTKSLGEVVSAYSHGMKQKLAIISALIHEPRLFILDEPFVGLDPKASHILKEMLKDMCAKGSAVFFSTHVLEVAEKLCNKVAIIDDGRIIAYGDTKDIVGDSSLENMFLELTDDEQR